MAHKVHVPQRRACQRVHDVGDVLDVEQQGVDALGCGGEVKEEGVDVDVAVLVREVFLHPRVSVEDVGDRLRVEVLEGDELGGEGEVLEDLDVHLVELGEGVDDVADRLSVKVALGVEEEDDNSHEVHEVLARLLLHVQPHVRVHDVARGLRVEEVRVHLLDNEREVLEETAIVDVHPCKGVGDDGDVLSIEDSLVQVDGGRADNGGQVPECLLHPAPLQQLELVQPCKRVEVVGAALPVPLAAGQFASHLHQVLVQKLVLPVALGVRGGDEDEVLTVERQRARLLDAAREVGGYLACWEEGGARDGV
mmetsp:Transcript_28025/g.90917  ORF Transcript_28025/g.90917 Transcript_28025/m.90917 type:complete len:308 (-) Transcript_28025:2253-3176(-)